MYIMPASGETKGTKTTDGTDGTTITRLVNGPINCARLEGTVFGIKKVVYLLMDYHEQVIYQAQCPGYVSEDLSHYLYSEFKNAKSTIDFFFELGITHIDQQSSPYRGRYIDETLRLFKDQYQKDKSNKVLPSKINPLVRLHYLDIRDIVVEPDRLLSQLLSTINKSTCQKEIYWNDLEIIKQALTLINQHLQEFYNIFFENSHTIKQARQTKQTKQTKKEDSPYILNVKYITNKLKNEYKHKQVRDKLEPFMEHAKELLKVCFEYISDMQSIIEDFRKKYKHITPNTRCLNYIPDVIEYGYGIPFLHQMDLLYKLDKLSYLLDRVSSTAYVYITDIFLLRRLLDKDYITHAIIYTGNHHSMNYIQHLVIEYDFKITMCSYPPEADMDTINEKIRAVKSYSDRYKVLEIFYPEQFTQCVDMARFPQGFK